MKQINERGLISEYIGQIEITGTYLIGHVEVSYQQLRTLFGAPEDGDGFKVDAEWRVMTPNGPASIYNYKDGQNYNGRQGTPKTKITDWHIGGSSPNTYAWVALAILSYSV